MKLALVPFPGTSSAIGPNMPINNFFPTLSIKISLLYTNLRSTYVHKEVAKAFSPETSIRIMYNLLQHKHSLDVIAG